MEKYQEIIPIFFAVDDKYVPFLAVTLQSLLNNASQENYYVIKILYTNMSEESKEKISKYTRENVNIEYVDLNYYIEKIKEKLYTRDYFSMTTYFRLFISNLYPQYNKAIYLDCDIVLLKDIAELYNIDIGDNLLGAVPDDIIQKNYVQQAQTYHKKYRGNKGPKNDDGTELKITTFQGIQDNCDVDEAWKKQYKLACFVNHGSPQGTFKRLSLMDEQSLIVVGQSDYGITTPAEHSAISLQWITSMFLSVFPCLDALAHAKVIHDWVEEVRKAYFTTADKCFGTNINYDENCGK